MRGYCNEMDCIHILKEQLKVMAQKNGRACKNNERVGDLGMTVRQLMELIGARNINESAPLDTEITCGYSCDLLSWVLAHGKQGDGLVHGADARERHRPWRCSWRWPA